MFKMNHILFIALQEKKVLIYSNVLILLQLLVLFVIICL